MSPDGLRTLTDLVRQRAGIELGPDKAYLVEARMAALLRETRLADLDSLARQVAHAPTGELARRAVEAVTVNETLFFRDAPCFEHLARQALPRLRAARPPGGRLRIWSAAASTGQEAYSIAMAADEAASTGAAPTIEVLATDISRAALERAAEGLYSSFEVGRGLSAERLRRHFTDSAEGWRVAPRLRAMVRCQPWNLLDNPAPLGRFDIVFCRNVLIYFSAETRRRVLDGIAEQLSPDGLLYLGGTETLLNVTDRFEPLPGERSIFTRQK